MCGVSENETFKDWVCSPPRHASWSRLAQKRCTKSQSEGWIGPYHAGKLMLMGVVPEGPLNIARAIAVFDAKVLLLRQGWDLERVRSLTWVVRAEPAEPGEERQMTFTAHAVDTHASRSGGSKSHTARTSGRDKVAVNPPPMPADPHRYWTSVTLRDEHTLTLAVSVSPARLRGDDRTVFNDLVNRLTAYQENTARADCSRRG